MEPVMEEASGSYDVFYDEWGPMGTMNKIHNMLEENRGPITLEKLVKEGPFYNRSMKEVVSTCYLSIRQLKLMGFIEVILKPGSKKEFTDIKFGKQILESLSSK